MKKSFVVIIALALLSGCASSSALVVNSEKPVTQDLSKYTTIYIGKLDIPADLWKSFGYQNRTDWLKVVSEVNKTALKINMAEQAPGKTVVAPVQGFTNEPGLYIKLTYKGYRKNTGRAYAHDLDSLDVLVEIYDNKTKQELYSANLSVTSVGTYKRGWMMNSLEGRIDNQIFNLCGFIAGKLK